MSNTYLDRFRSSLPTVQGNHILKTLISKRDSGEIKNVDEFKDKLKELTAEILAERITSTLKIFPAVPGEDTSSSQYNEMLRYIRNDLESAFSESDTLDEIIDGHQNLISEVALKALRFGINELESRIQLYEFLHKNSQGFDDAMFNTFRESLNNSTSRSQAAASLVYVDPRKMESIPLEEDAEVDQVGERLILGANVKNYLDVRKVVWLSNSNSIRSEVDVSIKSSNISNITDNKKNTFWTETILLKNIRKSGAPMEIGFNMNSSQDINFIEIEPASLYPMTLVGIDYFDSNNTRQTAESTEVTLSGPTRINFKRITTKSVILRLKQVNYREVQFSKKEGESNFEKAVLREPSNAVNLDSVSEDLRDLLTSQFILSDILNVKSKTANPLKYYEYLMGLDNVRLGFSTFNERGIFVSESKKVENLGQIALKVKEIRPVQNPGSASIDLVEHKYLDRSSEEDAKFSHGATEYYVISQFYSADDFLISTDIIPILPLGAKRVYHEQIIFTDQTSVSQNPNVGQLRFYTENNPSDVLLYRNGSLLTYGLSPSDDWDFVDSLDANVGYLTVTAPGTGSPMKRAIRIKSNVSLSDIYTVSYTPLTSNTYVLPLGSSSLMKIVDLLGDKESRMITENLISFGDLRLAQNVSYTKVYLMVIFRRNSAVENFSSSLEEYMIITGSKDSNKFKGV